MFGASGNKTLKGSLSFDSSIKVKEEETSDDESMATENRFAHLLKKNPVVELQPIDGGSLKRLSPSHAVKNGSSMQRRTNVRQVRVNGCLLKKSSDKKIGCVKTEGETINGLAHKTIKVQRKNVVQSNGLEKAQISTGSPRKERLQASDFLHGSCTDDGRNANIAWCPSMVDPALKSNDLRHIIGSNKKASRKADIPEQFSNGQEDHFLDSDGDGKNDIDSMSLHAEDDLELDFTENLAELGKHFESANSNIVNQSPGKWHQKENKRRNSDKDYHSPKKSKIDVQPGDFLRSKSLGDEIRKQKSETKRPPTASELKGHDKRWQQNCPKTERRHADDKGQLDSTRKDTEKPQNNNSNAQNLPFLNNGKHIEYLMKIPKIKDRDQNTDSARKDAEKPHNNRSNAQNMSLLGNGKHTEVQMNTRKVKDREQYMGQRNFVRKYDNVPPRMNDFGSIAPQFMQGLLPNVPAINGARPFLPNVPFYHGNGMQIRPLMSYDVRNPNMRQLQRPKENKIGQNTHQIFHLLDQKLQGILWGKDFESCISVCEEYIKGRGKLPIDWLEAMLRTAVEDDVMNLTSATITFLFAQIRKERELTVFRLEDFRYAIEAFVKVEDIDSAIDLIFEMKRRGIGAPQTTLLQIRNAIFASPVKNVDVLIKFCDELVTSNLLTKKLMEEVLKHVSIEEFRAKTNCLKVLELLQEFNVPGNSIQSSALQPRAATTASAVSILIRRIDEISPQENIPSDLIVKLIQCIKTSSEALSVITKLSKLPRDALTSVPCEIWNMFLVEMCSGLLADVQFANQIHGIITDNDIPLTNRSLLEFATLLFKDGKEVTRNAALEVFDRIELNDITEDDVTDGIFESLSSMIGNTRLDSTSFDYNILMILIKSKRFLADEKLNGVIANLKDSCSYQEVYAIFLELEKAGVVPSPETFDLTASILEEWEANLDAFLHVIKVMKQSYPQYRIFKDTGSIVSNVSVSSGCAQDATTATSPVKNVGAAMPTVSETRSMHSALAMPLKSPFEEILKRQQHSTSADNEPEETSLDNVFIENSPDVVTDLKVNEIECTSLPPNSASKSTECMGSSEYQKFYDEMVTAREAGNTEEVFQLYAKMRHSGLMIGNEILLEIYKTLIIENPAGTFKFLAEVIKQTIPLVQTIGDEDALFLVQDADQETLGRLGVRLLFFYLNQGEFGEAFSLLFLLHDLSINYTLYGLEFDGERSRTTCEIAMAAVQVCVNKDPRDLDGAMEVLRGANFAVPLESEDDTERKVVLERLANDLLDEEKYDDAYEVICQSDNERGWSLDAIELFSAVLLRFSEKNNVELARKVYDFIDQKEISISHKAFRAYLNCLARNGNIDLARALFETGLKMEVYPSQVLTNPYYFELPCNLTQIEMLFMLEEHLGKIKQTVYEGGRDVKSLKASQSSFKIILKENYELFETSKEQFAVAKENMAVVLKEMMNPPLRIIETEDPAEPLVIGANSILNWYEGTRPVDCNLSVTSSFDNNNSIQRTVQISPAEEPPHLLSGAGEASRAPLGDGAKTNANNSFKTSPLAEAICDRVKYYMRLGRVDRGKPYQNCCFTLTKLYLKRYEECRFEDYGNFREHAFAFVDNFFRSHEKFVPKQC